MKIWTTLIVGFAAVPVLADQVTMTVKSGTLTGTATVVNRILDDGSKYIQLSMNLSEGGRKVSVLQESTYSKAGEPTRKLQTTSMAGGGAKQSVVVTFEARTAILKVDAGGKSATEKVPFPTGKATAAKPEFWFIRDTPTPGAVSTYWRFDLSSQAWVETKTTYVGTRAITVDGRTVKAHLMIIGDVKAYVDEKGDPLKLVSPTISMERKW